MTREEYEAEKQKALKRRSEKFTAAEGSFTIKPAPEEEAQESATDIDTKR